MTIWDVGVTIRLSLVVRRGRLGVVGLCRLGMVGVVNMGGSLVHGTAVAVMSAGRESEVRQFGWGCSRENEERRRGRISSGGGRSFDDDECDDEDEDGGGGEEGG